MNFGNARKAYSNNTYEPLFFNKFSSFKGTNPRKVKRLSLVAGQTNARVPRFQLHRMMFRRFADANQLSGVRHCLYGPITAVTHPHRPAQAKPWANKCYDDLPNYT